MRKKIVDPDEFEDEPEVLAYGMLCALAAAGIWLIVATYLELPVSTTHSIIGCASSMCQVQVACMLAMCRSARSVLPLIW